MKQRPEQRPAAKPRASRSRRRNSKTNIHEITQGRQRRETKPSPVRGAVRPKAGRHNSGTGKASNDGVIAFAIQACALLDFARDLQRRANDRDT